MVSKVWSKIRNNDWLLLVAIVFLLVLSVTIMYGLSIRDIGGSSVTFIKQTTFAIAGIAIFVLMGTTNYRFWQLYSKVAYILILVSLVAVLLFGVTVRGTTGWLSIGGFTFQPVEFAKISLIILLAKYFSDHAKHIFMWRHIINSGLIMGLYVFLVLLQPDFGSAAVMVGMWFLFLLVVGIRRSHLIVLVTLFLITTVVGWFVFLQPYQKDRIFTFINPQRDALGVGYNVRQSIIAVGSGQLIGRGFGLGSQSQLKFLPEPETDFIFAVLAEDFGFVGVMLLFTGILVILYRLVTIAHQTGDNFAAYYALGVSSLLVVQSFINIGMNVGIAPVTGIPLPFISAGGSSLLSLMIATGIASSIYSDTQRLASK